jgi:hypothetical protein
VYAIRNFTTGPFPSIVRLTSSDGWFGEPLLGAGIVCKETEEPRDPPGCGYAIAAAAVRKGCRDIIVQSLPVAPTLADSHGIPPQL